jgi:hypothetical protein
VTLSFWVRSSVIGTFPVTFLNEDATRTFGAQYTISAANTWEYKSIAVSGLINGTWLTNNGLGIRVVFGLGGGTNRTASLGYQTTTGSVITNVTGSTQLIATSGATWNITGVQLEEGTAASPFENRLYGAELALCQRYFETSFIGAVSVSNTDNAGIQVFGGSSGATTTALLGQALVAFRVSKRSPATITVFDAAIPRNSGKVSRYQLGISNDNNQNATLSDNGIVGFNLYSSGTSNSSGFIFHYSASAEL